MEPVRWRVPPFLVRSAFAICKTWIFPGEVKLQHPRIAALVCMLVGFACGDNELARASSADAVVERSDGQGDDPD
jgi:hypothetical protein